MMSAEEIETIIRMQEAQLNNTGTNPFAEDFYYLMKKQKPGKDSIYFTLFKFRNW
jgi:hypothetical protein